MPAALIISMDSLVEPSRITHVWDYRHESGVDPPLILKRELGVAGVVNRVKVARNFCA
jgi:hypothetical protein